MGPIKHTICKTTKKSSFLTFSLFHDAKRAKWLDQLNDPSSANNFLLCCGASTERRASIRGHSPKRSLGDKILTIREGDCKNCFREREGKHLLGYGKDTGRKFSFSRFCHKNTEDTKFLHLFSFVFPKNPQNV